MFKKSNNIFCPNCLSPELFTKTNNQFMKCLNCCYKVCKYCLRDYNIGHLDIKKPNHCKVYFRREDEIYKKPNCVMTFLREVGFIICIFLLSILGIFINSYVFFQNKFLAKNNNNCLYYSKKVLIIFTSILIFVIICPLFIVIFFPFFPIINSIFDY